MKDKFFKSRPDTILDALQTVGLRFLMGNSPISLPDSPIQLPIEPLSSERKLNANEALQEIDGLGVTQLLALIDNYQYGLRGNDLRELHTSGVTIHHFNALKALIQEENLLPKQAIEKLVHTTPEEAKQIAGASEDYSNIDKIIDKELLQNTFKY